MDPFNKPIQMVSIVLVVFCIAFLYLSVPIEFSDNGVHYLNAVKDMTLEDPYFYPPHLLHAAIIGLIYYALPSIFSCDVFCAGVLHSALWAIIAILSTFLLMRVLLNSTLGALATALIALVSHGFWVYATQPEVYVPTVACLMAATALLFTNRSPTLSSARIIGVSVFWVLATTYHLISAVFFLPLCVYFLVIQRERGWLQLGIVSALAGTTVLLTFIFVYMWDVNEPLSLASFLTWALEITNRPLTDWGSTSNWWRPRRIASGILSQSQALVALPEFLNLNQEPPFDRLPLFFAGIVCIGVAFWNAFLVFGKDHFARVRLYFLVFFLSTFLTFSWWQPGVHKFYIPSSIPLIILIAFSISDLRRIIEGTQGRRVISGAVISIIAIVFLFNLPSVMELKKSRGPYYAEAEALNRLAPKECTIYSLGQHFGPLKLYLSRTNTRFVVLSEREYFLQVKGELDPNKRMFEGEACTFVAIGFLTEARFDKTIKRYAHTVRWPDYIAYFLDVRPSAETGGITYNPFELVAKEDVLTYLIIDRRKRVDGTSLDEIVETIRAAAEDTLQKLAPKHPVDPRMNELLTLPQTDLAIRRERIVIFGYGWTPKKVFAAAADG